MLPTTRLRRAAVAPLLASLVIAGAPILAAERTIHLQGRVVDPQGRGLEGQAVRLFKTKRGLDIGRFSSGGQVTEATRVDTDAEGFFEIRIPRDRAYDHYFIRFYDPVSFDQVRYQLPADREITRELRRREILQFQVELRWQDSWPDVQLRVREVGEESPEGKVLLAMGMPEREKTARGPDGLRQEWWYHSRGIVYFFAGGRAAGFRKFDPVKFVPPIEGGF